jgi:hypothetical protein
MGALLVLALFAAGAFGFEMITADSAPPEEPYAVMSIGHRQASDGRSLPALVAYEEAILLDPELAKNKRMRDNVEQMLDKDAPPVVAETAIDFLGTLVSQAGDQAAAVQLIDLASSSKDLQRRHKAFSVANEVGLGDRIDRLASFTLDLKQGKTCVDRKQAVANLRALGNQDAIPDLRKARYRPRGGLGRKKVNTNACLRASAREAIQHLKSL